MNLRWIRFSVPAVYVNNENDIMNPLLFWFHGTVICKKVSFIETFQLIEIGLFYYLRQQKYWRPSPKSGRVLA